MPDLRQPTFSIVVPTFRRQDVLGRTLDALLATDYPSDRFEVIIVDDADENQTRDIAACAAGGEVELQVLSGAGRGAAAARNQGSCAAGGEFLVFVDDDILVPPRHLAAQLETRSVHGDCISGADWWEFTPEVLAELKGSPLGRYRLAVEQSYRRRSEERWLTVTGLATAHLTVHRELFDELGRFDERFPRAGVEDWEFCLRARERGHTLILDNAIALLHNDRRLTLRQLCLREEWRGRSVGVLSQLRPAAYRQSEAYRENSPVQPDDPTWLRIRKATKQVLGLPILLEALHATMGLLEHIVRADRVLHRLYRAVISVHYLRGFRAGLTSRLQSEPPALDGVGIRPSTAQESARQ